MQDFAGQAGLKMRGPMTDGSTILLQGVNFHMTTLLEI
jgi:hypothetical protein